MESTPSYRLHKSSGQAICCISGRTYYLGKYGSPESRVKYYQYLALYKTDPTFGVEKESVSIAEAVVSFLKHAKSYYRSGDEYYQCCHACKPLVSMFGTVHLSDFSTKVFKAYRQHWVSSGNARGYVNKQSQRLMRIVSWWVSEELIDPGVLHKIREIEPLKKGRCDCPETEPVKPVDDATIEKTLPHLSPVVADMVRLQAVLGCRPGELCKLKPSMIDQSKDIWIIRLQEHKNAWREDNRPRIIAVGPKAQQILNPYLARPASEFCFQPKESVEQRLRARESQRKTPRSCGNRRGTNRKTTPKRVPGESFSTNTYGRAIAYACKKAQIPLWSPNQLRHKVATELRELEGIEAASVILGHAHLPTTEIYAEKSTKRAVEVALKHG
jgi:integrase